MHFPPIYNHYWFVPQQYPMVEYNMYKFIEFFIYFLIHKLVANNLYLPFEWVDLASAIFLYFYLISITL